ncbi:MAG: hypothetical protein CMF38_02285 [Legionellaceae bacterium]|nr:hypothetical protein [Legionellaceae bacterium]HAF87283.1 hypothetical protein [Legionellales bacterium]HCA89280.1 hypothetical protein [Legionellales bacterium]|tara:strand:- start:1953 stop:2378 length:426 start_codon:yes stop_codon:yes gene_type:complete
MTPTRYVGRLHWLIFLNPTLLALLAMSGLFINELLNMALLILLAAILWWAATWLNYYASSLSIGPKSVVFRTGILVRNTCDIPLNKIESVDIKQSIIGSICRYGSLTVVGTGGTQQVIHYLDRPLTCRRYIESLMHEDSIE